jgi:hypothetical protein
MSQQGTPLGLTTPLNHARMSAGTFSYWPLSKACAVLASAARTAVTICRPSAFSRFMESMDSRRRLFVIQFPY